MELVGDLECGIRRAEDEIEVWKSRLINQVEFQKLELEKEISVQLEKELEALILSKISVQNKLKELETQVELKLRHEVEMEKELEVYKSKCDGLGLELVEKKRDCVVVEDSLKDLMIAKVAVDDELKEYKTTCRQLEERISRLEEEQKVVGGAKAKKAQERIKYLSKELKKRESDETEKYVHQLQIEKKNLKSAKGRAEDEVVVWKIKFGELENQAALRMKHENKLEKELGVYKTKCNGLKMELDEKKMESVGIMDKLKDLMVSKMAVDDELKGCMTMCNEQKEQIMVLEKDMNILRGKERRDEERITHLSMELREIESVTNGQLKKEIKNLKCGKSRMENEIEVWKKRFRELETQVLRLNQVTLEKIETEKELEAYKIQCHGLSAELEKKKLECSSVVGKLKDLLLRKIEVEVELKMCKATCNGLEERIMGLEEDQKVLCEKEKRSQDRIISLEEKIKNKENDETEKYREIVTESMDFKLPKKRGKYNNGIWEKRFRDLETQVFRMKQVELEKTELEKELDILFTNYEEFYKELEEKKIECIAVEENFEALKLRRIAGEDELKEYKRTCNGLKEQIIDLEEYQKVFIINGKKAQERISYLEEEVRRMENDRDKPGGLESEVSYNDNRKKDRNRKLQSETDSRTDGVPHFKIQEKMLSYPDFAGCDYPSLLEGNRDVLITGPASIIMLSKPLVNGKEEKENTPLKPEVDFGSRIRKEQVVEFEESSTKTLALLEKGTVRPASCGMVDIRNCEDTQEIPPKHTCNIRAKEIVYVPTDNTSERLDKEKDLRSKKCLKRPCSDVIEEECMSTWEEESMASSKQRQNSLRQCEEKMNCGERRSRNKNRSPCDLQMSGISQHRTRNLMSKNVKENVVDDVAFVESLGEIIKCSDSSNSGDSSRDSKDDRDMDLSLNQVIARIKKNRVKDSKWQFEADMLSSIEVDSELCMKAVCALYRRQISEEKSIKDSLHSKNRGFNSHDMLRGATLAEFLIDGNWKENLKKSVKELEMFDPKALEDCKRLATLYSTQLFDIYQSREDPFFLPSGV